MLILGIDPGSKFLGWSVILSEGKNKPKLVDCGLITPSKAKSIDELGYYTIFKELLNVLKKYNPDHCYIERYMPYKGRSKGAYVVPAVIAIVRLCWYTYSKTKANLAPASTWKKVVMREPYADKTAIKKFVLKSKITKDKSLKQDTYDSILIAVYGHMHKNKINLL